MPKALVIHPDFYAAPGGGERVSAAIISTLREMGYEIYFYTKPPFNKVLLKELLGLQLTDITHIAFPKWSFYNIVKYYDKVIKSIYLTTIVRNRLRADIKPDIEISTQDIEYLVGAGSSMIAYVNNILIPHKGAILPYRLYCKIGDMYFLRKKNLNKISILCNSNFTKKKIKKLWKQEAIVLYPPVNTEIFSPLQKEDKQVITVGRFDPWKNHGVVLKIAKQLPDFKFIIAGVIQDKNYYIKLLHNAGNLGNVSIYGNLPLNKLRFLLGQSKIYLHTAINETFGITVVEAIASGCIPVVHNSGGPAEIVGNLGYKYSDIPECIRCLIKASKSSIDIEKLTNRAKQYDQRMFKRKMREIIKEITV